jgi:energy-coupling factor transporter ATP-binding protein EcfA2
VARVFISHSSLDKEPAARIMTWLKGQGFDTAFLDFDKHAGIPPGADWERTLYREIEQSEAVIIIQTPNWLASKWCFVEFTQARALGKAIFPVIETPTGDTLISPDIQALDLRSDCDGGLEALSRQLTRIALDAQGGFAWDARRPPYPGLLAFQEEDAAIYFGRDDDIRRLIERLNARRAQGGAKLIALLGASGSGKSSLLRAGVIPRLKRAGRTWIVVPPMRPQVRPLDELARALALAGGQGTDWRKLQDDLLGADVARALDGIAGDLRIKAGAGEAQILIPVDQAEELFGAADAEQSARFVEIISRAMAYDLPFMAVMALRSDYLGQLQSATHLTARFEEFSLGPLPLARIPQIIQGPARVAGLKVEDAFVAQAARDAETEDALPLLAFALRELLDRSGGDNYLSLDEYKALGDDKGGLTPLENAVRRAADDVLAEAKPADDELSALREAFVPAMVRVNDQGDYVRRPARLDDLPAKSHPLLERLAKARLLIVRQGSDARMVEVAHEALLRKWPRLRSWLDEAREFLVGKQQLEQDLRDWEQAPAADKDGALLAGLKLNRARGWLATRPQQLTPQERAFIQASTECAETEAEERRRSQSRRNIARASVAAALLLTCAAAFSGLQWRTAVKAEQTALKAEQEARRAEGIATAAQEKTAQAQAITAKVLDETKSALTQTDKARKEADEAREKTVKAQEKTAEELIRYSWMDLANRQQEAARLNEVAKKLKVKPDVLLPSILCANADCSETKKQQPGDFDCKTSLDSGFRYLYCSIRSIVSFDKVQAISGLNIFRPGGPHDSREANFDDPVRFGHYNPQFLDWVEQRIIPDRSDPWFKGMTQLVYDTRIGPTARALYQTHQVLFADPQRYDVFLKRYESVGKDYREKLRLRKVNEMRFETKPVPLETVKARYQKGIEDKKKDVSFDLQEDLRWLADYFGTSEGTDWYLTYSAGGFWVRRSLDGTEGQIFRMLTKLLQMFEPSVLAKS